MCVTSFQFGRYCPWNPSVPSRPSLLADTVGQGEFAVFASSPRPKPRSGMDLKSADSGACP